MSVPATIYPCHCPPSSAPEITWPAPHASTLIPSADHGILWGGGFITSRGCPLHSTNLLSSPDPPPTRTLWPLWVTATSSLFWLPASLPHPSLVGRSNWGRPPQAHLSQLLTQPLPCHAEALAQPLLCRHLSTTPSPVSPQRRGKWWLQPWMSSIPVSDTGDSRHTG